MKYTEREKEMDNVIIEEIFEADSAGWTVTEIADYLKITRQQVIDLFLSYERYEPGDPELNR
jgi:hypothetical protein